MNHECKQEEITRYTQQEATLMTKYVKSLQVGTIIWNDHT